MRGICELLDFGNTGISVSLKLVGKNPQNNIIKDVNTTNKKFSGGFY